MGSKIHKDVSSQWEKTLLTGLSEEIRQKLISKYPTPENCILLAPPKLNPEAKLASMESAIKRDERLQAVQRQIGASVAALGKLLTALLSAEEKEEGAYLEWIGLTGDACRLLTDLHCQQSEARKSLLNLNFRKELKDVILEARSDEFLFGKNLSDRIKEAKAMERSGLDLKQKKTPTLQRKPFSQNQGNYKSPPKRRPPPRLGGQTSFYQQQYRKGSTQYRHSTTQNKGLYRSTRQK
ncbi:hypothetical protein PPYR_10961 [Photinus pyralis]|uniref:Uncharacterized protein n=3 Tax=Photinus pyralis TaxID=7054 RepID=A0A5N4AHR5_PHOPY|nr:hypothetical protein PPYR_10961 [Photinus pyralis]